MCRRLFLVSVMVAAGLIVLPQACFAQQFPGDFPNPARSYGYANGGFQQGWSQVGRLPFPYGAMNGNSAPVYSAAVLTSYPPASAQVVAVEPTLIHVRVPANAKVYFDSSPTKQTGAERYYRTPALAGGRPLTYEVSARWQENGKERMETRLVRFLPGQTLEVNFTPAAATGVASR